MHPQLWQPRASVVTHLQGPSHCVRPYFSFQIPGGLLLTFTSCRAVIDTMYEKLNPRWSGTIFGGVAAVLAVIPFILIFKGPQIRAASKVAQTLIEVEKK